MTTAPTAKRGRGRPPHEPADRRSETLSVRVVPALADAVDQAARAAGQRPADWHRAALAQAALAQAALAGHATIGPTT